MARIAHSHRPLDERDQACTIWYMKTYSSVEIAAPASLVWDVFSDVERWPEWTASVTRLVALDGPGISVGNRFEIKQPRMPKLVWEVTEVTPGVAWTWVQRSPGGVTRRYLELEAAGLKARSEQRRVDGPSS